VCGVANIYRVEICCIGSRGTAGEFLSVSQVIFTPIVMFIKKIRPHTLIILVSDSSVYSVSNFSLHRLVYFHPIQKKPEKIHISGLDFFIA
jgi:hypothetical protein